MKSNTVDRLTAFLLAALVMMANHLPIVPNAQAAVGLDGGAAAKDEFTGLQPGLGNVPSN